MDAKSVIEYLEKLEPSSTEFWGIYQAANKKYFGFKNPSKYHQAMMALNSIIHSGVDWLICLTAEVANGVCGIKQGKMPSFMGSYSVDGKMVMFEFYTDEKSKSQLFSLLKESVLSAQNVNKSSPN